MPPMFIVYKSWTDNFMQAVDRELFLTACPTVSQPAAFGDAFVPADSLNPC